ncbi:hypothetical protein SFR_2134 [Streptomyces sp. FR-008]|nr:hypothetical protein SFR_2134 [Streptomyces sp. FR-008]
MGLPQLTRASPAGQHAERPGAGKVTPVHPF